jgi:hypothetical protein
MPKYRLVNEAGVELGEPSYAVWIKPGEIVHVGAATGSACSTSLPIEEEGSPSSAS